MSDYLWDGTGEPDAEAQHLERLLSDLRHRGEPPAMALPARPRRALRSGLAVAATLLIAALAPGVWWGLRNEENDPQNRQAAVNAGRAAMPGVMTNQDVSALPAEATRPPRAQDDTPSAQRAEAARRRMRARNPGAQRGINQRVALARAPGATRNLPPANAPRSLPTERVITGTIAQRAAQDDRRAGAQASAQLLLALRIASARLNFAQRRMQEQPAAAPPPESLPRDRIR